MEIGGQKEIQNFSAIEVARTFGTVFNSFFHLFLPEQAMFKSDSDGGKKIVKPYLQVVPWLFGRIECRNVFITKLVGDIVHTLIAIQNLSHVVGIEVFKAFFFLRFKLFGVVIIGSGTKPEGFVFF